MPTTGQREISSSALQLPLYQRLLGDAWYTLPPTLIAMHSCKSSLQARGVAHVKRGSGWLSRLIASAIGFPEQGMDVPVQVSFHVHRGGERWVRTFAGKTFSSFQIDSKGTKERLLSESFGPFTFGLALVTDAKKLRLIVRCWSFLGIPLPAFLAPSGDSYEFEDNGRFHFNVEIRHPLAGLIVHYRGWLTVT